MTLALKAWGQRLIKRTGAKRPKCSRAATQIQASPMSHVGTKLTYRDVRYWAAFEGLADVSMNSADFRK